MTYLFALWVALVIFAVVVLWSVIEISFESRKNKQIKTKNIQRCQIS